MNDIVIAPHLTAPQGRDMQAMQLDTAPGMAFWAGSGPAGKTCRECFFWVSFNNSYKREEDGSLKPRRCKKYKYLSYGVTGDGVPHDKRSCKYFEQAATPAKIDGRNTPKEAAPS